MSNTAYLSVLSNMPNIVEIYSQMSQMYMALEYDVQTCHAEYGYDYTKDIVRNIEKCYVLHIHVAKIREMCPEGYMEDRVTYIDLQVTDLMIKIRNSINYRAYWAVMDAVMISYNFQATGIDDVDNYTTFCIEKIKRIHELIDTIREYDGGYVQECIKSFETFAYCMSRALFGHSGVIFAGSNLVEQELCHLYDNDTGYPTIAIAA